MEHFIAAFNRITLFFSSRENNFENIGTYHFKPHLRTPNLATIEAHQRIVMQSFKRHLYDHEISHIINDHIRIPASPDHIMADLLKGDIPYHSIPFDEHVEIGLQSMSDAFRPPQPCRPVHILDVRDKYPYKWHVNSEPPFSTDEYFLDNRKQFKEFWDPESRSFTKYVDPLDADRRYGHSQSDQWLEDPTPAMFGFQKGQIFSWTRRWHHVIKSGFTDTTGLESTAYLRDRYIFPMLLHTKTAITKPGNPAKMRTIWGCSKPWIIADTMFYWEYNAYLKQHRGYSPMLWGYETITGGWFRLNYELSIGLDRQSFVTIDWSRFDKYAHFELIHHIMSKVRTFLDFNNGYVPTYQYPRSSHQWDDHQSQRLENLWNWTLENIYDAPIAVPDGTLFKRRFAGIPSGLYITQLLDSWYNYTMIATLLSALGFAPNKCIIKVQGDDSIIRLHAHIPRVLHSDFMASMEQQAQYYFGAILSTAKSEIHNSIHNVEVLSYRNYHGFPRRDEITMLAQLYYTKSNNCTPEISMGQTIGFAYAACGNHKRVHDMLHNLYTFYYDQGYRASRAGLTLVFGNSPDLILPHMEVSSFPSINKVKEYLLASDYINEHTYNRTWPLDYFKYPPCARHDDETDD